LAHTLFLTCAGALFMFRSSSGRYFEKLKNSIFITAYTDCRQEAKLAVLKKKLEAVEDVKKAVILTEDEVFATLEGALAKKDILLSIKNIKIPVLCKVYPRSLDYENYRKISDEISALKEIKYSDAGGKAVKNLFIHADNFKKTVNFITALLLIAALTAAMAALMSTKYLQERFRFFSERGVPYKDILFKYAAETVIIPLSSLIVSILILLAFRQTTGGNIVVFINAPQILLLAVLSALPWAARLIKPNNPKGFSTNE